MEQEKYPILDGNIMVLGDARIRTGKGGRCDMCFGSIAGKKIIAIRLHNADSAMAAAFHLDCFDILIERYQEAIEEHRLRLLIEE